MRKITTETIAAEGIIAAVYAAMCILLAPLSFMAVQFRFSEALMILPFFNKKHTIGLTLGCFIANIFSPLPLDMLFGTAATLLACVAVSLMKNKLLISVAAAAINGIIVGAELYFVFGGQFLPLAASVFVGEVVVVQIGVFFAIVA
ncbi:MAG: QueT transporter family protein, partial [Clostridiales bacterium]|nr:QueT transporter family protein [Clostridiales bacterium]